MIKIIHAADLHLDSAFAALTPQQARERRAHQRQLVRDLVELGNEEQVDLILLAGDLFDGENAYYETAEALSDAFSKSRARIFIAPGNHDPYSADSPYRSVRFSENVHLFRAQTIERVPLPQLGCVVYGAGFVTPACATPLLAHFCAHDDALSLMVLHGEVGNPASTYNPISEQQIGASGLDYLALGHVHSASGLLRAGETVYAYPGTPEGRGFDEIGEKGILIGTVAPGAIDLKFRKISPYSYTERIINIEESNLDSILQQIPADCTHEVCRMILQGACAAPDLAAWEQALSGRFYSLRLIDRSHAPRDIWAAVEEESVKGMFLRRLRAMMETADEETRHVLARAAAYGVAALENREDVR